MDRSHLAAEKAAREEEQLHEQCTFRPDLPTKRAADAIAAAAVAGAAAGRDVCRRGDASRAVPGFFGTFHLTCWTRHHVTVANYNNGKSYFSQSKEG